MDNTYKNISPTLRKFMVTYSLYKFLLHKNKTIKTELIHVDGVWYLLQTFFRDKETIFKELTIALNIDYINMLVWEHLFTYRPCDTRYAYLLYQQVLDKNIPLKFLTHIIKSSNAVDIDMFMRIFEVFKKHTPNI